MRSILLASLVFSLTLTACVQTTDTSQNHNADLTFSIASAPRTLDPRYATDATSFRLAQLLYKAPVKFDDQLNPIPWLTSWKTLDDRTYQLTIFDGQTFSDGTLVTSDDLISTYESVLDHTFASPHRGGLSNISSIERQDTQTVVFRLHQADPLFMSDLVIGVMSKENTSKKLIDQPNSSGSFKLDHWDGEGDVFLSRRQDQFRVHFRVTKDATVQTLQMIGGEVDIIQGGLPQELVSYLSEKNQFSLKQRAGSRYTYLGFNMLDPDLSNVNIRRAIALSIDREAIVEHLFNNKAMLTQSMLPSHHWASNQNLDIIDRDLGKAKVLLKAAGYDLNNPLKLSYKTSKSNFRLRIATLIQHQLREANINLKIQSYDWGTFYDDIKNGNFQLYSLSWVGIKNPNIYRYVFHSKSTPPDGANRGRYFNQEIDSLIDQSQIESDLHKKQTLYFQLQEKLHQDLPYISLWHEQQYAIMSEKAQAYQLSSDGNFLSLENLEINQY